MERGVPYSTQFPNEKDEVEVLDIKDFARAKPGTVRSFLEGDFKGKPAFEEAKVAGEEDEKFWDSLPGLLDAREGGYARGPAGIPWVVVLVVPKEVHRGNCNRGWAWALIQVPFLCGPGKTSAVVAVETERRPRPSLSSPFGRLGISAAHSCWHLVERDHCDFYSSPEIVLPLGGHGHQHLLAQWGVRVIYENRPGPPRPSRAG